MEEEAILGFLQNNDEIPHSGQFAVDHNIDHEELKNVIKNCFSLHRSSGKRYAAEKSPPFVL
ncbi:hypothetical protein Bca52824_020105 [Brassica carinata]|uniref:Uncharacterized protein n=1 Tax=Brassica carinata TaxID=52824 RepID=A0A8X7VS22_BRACI|nr:hypothetical protein Bca52824_020105 [Brassica carinata]